MLNLRAVSTGQRCVVLALWAASALHADSSGLVTSLSQKELQELLAGPNADEVLLIDVRTAKEFAKGRIPGAINMPHDLILKDTSVMADYPAKKWVFYCHSGYRAGKVTAALAVANRVGIYHLRGDFRAWRGNFLPIEE